MSKIEVEGGKMLRSQIFDFKIRVLSPTNFNFDVDFCVGLKITGLNLIPKRGHFSIETGMIVYVSIIN